MKKKWMILAVIAMAAVMVLVGCAGKKEASEDKKKSSKASSGKDTSADRETLIVGFDAEYPPYGFRDDTGEYVGFDLDCAQLVCDELGWKLEKKPLNWDSKDMELNSGTIDCIWSGFSITPARQDEYTWSDPYVDNTQVMVVAADSNIKSLKELKGKNVVVQAASAALEALHGDDCKDLTASFASLNENPDYNTAFMNLESGSADAIAVDIGVAQYQIAQREQGKYVIIGDPFYVEQYGIGFRVGDVALKDAVQAELLKLVESGKYEEIAVKYGIDPKMLCLGK
ncbi:MAG: amino acid ABC transporter substrate-binding protein [Lachnospiraceae bacterium]